MPESDFEKARYCSRCGQPVVVEEADFCKDCGAPLAGVRIFVSNPGFNPFLAAVLSIIPGLGHLYKGNPGRAVMWFLLVTFTYPLNPGLGLLLHFICAANAALKGAIEDDAFSSRLRPRHRRRRHRGSPPSFGEES
ncbi:MAG: NADH pyrophosphatase zinc ribbon domain-containing protein [Candidatus Binataceae bacterium]